MLVAVLPGVVVKADFNLVLLLRFGKIHHLLGELKYGTAIHPVV